MAPSLIFDGLPEVILTLKTTRPSLVAFITIPLFFSPKSKSYKLKEKQDYVSCKTCIRKDNTAEPWQQSSVSTVDNSPDSNLLS